MKLNYSMECNNIRLHVVKGFFITTLQKSFQINSECTFGGTLGLLIYEFKAKKKKRLAI